MTLKELKDYVADPLIAKWPEVKVIVIDVSDDPTYTDLAHDVTLTVGVKWMTGSKQYGHWVPIYKDTSNDYMDLVIELFILTINHQKANQHNEDLRSDPCKS